MRCACWASARRVRIVISRAPDQGIRMTIGDDGVGMDAADAATGGANGIGLRTMQYRAEVAGGTLRFESDPGHGTRIICDLPGAACVAPAPSSDADGVPIERAEARAALPAAVSNDRAA